MRRETNYECAIITGATAVLMREAFNLWNRGGESYDSMMEFKVIDCVTMYNATTMLVFYHVPVITDKERNEQAKKHFNIG